MPIPLFWRGHLAAQRLPANARNWQRSLASSKSRLLPKGTRTACHSGESRRRQIRHADDSDALTHYVPPCRRARWAARPLMPKQQQRSKLRGTGQRRRPVRGDHKAPRCPPPAARSAAGAGSRWPAPRPARPRRRRCRPRAPTSGRCNQLTPREVDPVCCCTASGVVVPPAGAEMQAAAALRARR